MRHLKSLAAFNRRATRWTLSLLACSLPVWATDFDLAELSIEELMDVRVSVVTRGEQPWFESAAAVYVLTDEDIRRSGFTTIPDLLRLVPGMQVARIDAHTWAVGARGLNGRFSNKLLVLIDGRTVYTSLFSGVLWDAQDLMIEDIDRIEVIRGPGASLWGSNAVNGVINIITKFAQDTQGHLAVVGAGGEERGSGAVRQGGTLGTAAYRVYAKYRDRDRGGSRKKLRAHDAWDMWRGGFRVDWSGRADERLTLIGDYHAGDQDQTVDKEPILTPPFSRSQEYTTHVSGVHLVARWQRDMQRRGELQAAVSLDRSDREDPIVDERRTTVDLEVQHRLAVGTRHQLVWGLGMRSTSDAIDSSFVISIDPRERNVGVYSGFVQDEVRLASGRLRATAGTRVEHNDFSGVEIQPNARILWMPTSRQALWAAVSRAVRLPTRSEADGRFVASVSSLADDAVAVVELRGSRGFDSEEVVTFEGGVRSRPTRDLTLDVAGYYSLYESLRTGEPAAPIPDTTATPRRSTIPFMASNKAEGTTYGVEVAADWGLRPWWRWRLAYNYLNMDVDLDSDSESPGTETIERDNPEHQLVVRSSWDLRSATADVSVRRVAELPSRADAYTTLDARLAWRPQPDLELSVAALNLLDAPRQEFKAELINILTTKVRRSAHVTARWGL